MADPTTGNTGGNPFLNQLSQWGPVIGAGTQLIGSGMASNQMNTANQLGQFNAQRQFLLGQQERQRRDAMTRASMPALLQGMGMNPQQIQQFLATMPSGSPSDPTYSANAFGTPPSIGGSGAGVSKGIGYGLTGLGAYGAAKNAGILPSLGGAAGGGAGAAGGIGAGYASGLAGIPGAAAAGSAPALGATGALAMPDIAAPAAAPGVATGGLGAIGSALGTLASSPLTWIGAAGLGGGLLAKSLIGQGRKTANDWVQGTGGAQGMGGQNDYGNQLAQISNEMGTNPNKARQDFINAYNQYYQNANQFANANPGNSNRATVINQMWNKTPALQQTNETLAKQLGINNFQWGKPYQAGG